MASAATPVPRVASLQLHEERCAQPRYVREVAGRRGGGVVGDSHAHRTTRAVLVVDRSTLDDLGLRAGDLREQITVEGIPGVTNLATGARLHMGGLTLMVNGPCEPCTHIGEMLGVPDPEELRQRLLGRRGVLCTVVDANGVLRIGDEVEVEASS
jgi:MOSC domain-containing protein YiiM